MGGADWWAWPEGFRWALGTGIQLEKSPEKVQVRVQREEDLDKEVDGEATEK